MLKLSISRILNSFMKIILAHQEYITIVEEYKNKLTIFNWRTKDWKFECLKYIGNIFFENSSIYRRDNYGMSISLVNMLPFSLEWCRLLGPNRKYPHEWDQKIFQKFLIKIRKPKTCYYIKSKPIIIVVPAVVCLPKLCRSVLNQQQRLTHAHRSKIKNKTQQHT